MSTWNGSFSVTRGCQSQLPKTILILHMTYHCIDELNGSMVVFGSPRDLMDTFSRDLTTSHLGLSHFALWIMGSSLVWLIPFNARAPLVTLFRPYKETPKKSNFLQVYHFSISQYFQDVHVKQWRFQNAEKVTHIKGRLLQWFSTNMSLFKIGTSIGGKNLLPDRANSFL